MRVIGLALAVSIISASAQPAAGQGAFPKASEADLDNGLHLIILEQKKNPFVSFQLSIPGAGGYYDADDARGLARATAELIEKGGTLTRSPSEVSAELARIEGQLWVHADSTSRDAEMWGRCPVEHATKLLELATDLMLHPAFAEEDVARYTQRLRESFVEPLDEPIFQALDVFDRVIDRNRGLADLAPDPATVDRITRESVAEFHRTRYVPDYAVLAVAGDVSPFAAKFYIGQKLGGWQRRDAERPPVWNPETEVRPRIVLVPRPGSTAPMVVARSQPVARTSKDYEVLELMNWAVVGIGERSLQILHDDAALDEIRELHDLRISADELADAKRGVLATFEKWLDSPVILQYAIDRWQEKLPPDYWDTYPSRINAVTVEQVQEAAQKYLAPDRLQIVAVGDPGRITEPLRKLGAVETYDAAGNGVGLTQPAQPTP